MKLAYTLIVVLISIMMKLDSRMFGTKQYKPFKVVYSNNDIEVFDTKPQLAKKINVSRSLVRLWLCKESFTYKNYNIKSIEYI